MINKFGTVPVFSALIVDNIDETIPTATNDGIISIEPASGAEKIAIFLAPLPVVLSDDMPIKKRCKRHRFKSYFGKAWEED